MKIFLLAFFLWPALGIVPAAQDSPVRRYRSIKLQGPALEPSWLQLGKTARN